MTYLKHFKKWKGLNHLLLKAEHNFELFLSKGFSIIYELDNKDL